MRVLGKREGGGFRVEGGRERSNGTCVSYIGMCRWGGVEVREGGHSLNRQCFGRYGVRQDAGHPENTDFDGVKAKSVSTGGLLVSAFVQLLEQYLRRG